MYAYTHKNIHPSIHPYIHNGEFHRIPTEGAPAMFGSKTGSVTKIRAKLNSMNLDAN
jgi:hypothetical protein